MNCFCRSCRHHRRRAAPAEAAGNETGAASALTPAEARSSEPAPAASPRFIYGTPGEKYPYYAGLPKELWPYNKVEPYERFFVTRMPFRGPGRDYPPPADLKSLKIGLLDSPKYGPNWDRSVSTREGIVLAVEEANRARQPGQLPFELVEREGVAQWGGAGNLAADLADQGVLGFLGTIDGAEAHVALRVTLKTEVVMINTSDPDPTLTETNIPWLIRVFPDHRLEEARLAELIVHQFGCQRIAILREGDRYRTSRGALLHGLRPTPGLPCGPRTAFHPRANRHPAPDRRDQRLPAGRDLLHRRTG